MLRNTHAPHPQYTYKINLETVYAEKEEMKNTTDILKVIKLPHKWAMAHQIKAHCLRANLGCGVDYIWDQLGMPVRVFLIVVFEVGRPTLTLGHTFWWRPT